MKRLILSLLLALGVIGSVTGIIPGTPASTASAYVTDVFRHYVHSGNHSWEIAVDRHSNGVFVLNAYRWTPHFRQYLGHEIHAETYDFTCFRVIDPADIYANVRIELKPNYVSYGTEGNSCDTGGIHYYCNAWHVWAEGGGFKGADENFYLCPWNFSTGNMAYGATAPLRNAGFSHFNNNYFELL